MKTEIRSNPYACKSQKKADKSQKVELSQKLDKAPKQVVAPRRSALPKVALTNNDNTSRKQLDPHAVGKEGEMKAMTSTKKNISLKSKLKKDIEELKRASMLRKRRLDEEKSRKSAEKKRKLEEKAQAVKFAENVTSPEDSRDGKENALPSNSSFTKNKTVDDCAKSNETSIESTASQANNSQHIPLSREAQPQEDPFEPHKTAKVAQNSNPVTNRHAETSLHSVPFAQTPVSISNTYSDPMLMQLQHPSIAYANAPMGYPQVTAWNHFQPPGLHMPWTSPGYQIAPQFQQYPHISQHPLVTQHLPHLGLVHPQHPYFNPLLQHPYGAAPAASSSHFMTKPDTLTKSNTPTAVNSSETVKRVSTKWVQKISDALVPPSPFANTHKRVDFPITIVKQPSQSFAMTLELEERSALVDDSWGSNVNVKVDGTSIVSQDSQEASTMEGSTVRETKEAGASNTAHSTTIPKKSRRKRVSFTAVCIQDAKEQNARLAQLQKDILLKKGDLILSVEGEDLCGKTFEEVCSLFRRFEQLSSDGWIRCTLTIARIKEEPQQIPKATTSSNVKLTDEFRTGPLSAEEERCLYETVLDSLLNPKRLLGSKLSESDFCDQFSSNPALSKRSPAFVVKCLTQSLNRERLELDTRANKFWEAKKEQDPVAVNAFGGRYPTDAERSAMRSKPRPSKGCKCGAETHEFVYDPSCPLYSNLRTLDSSQSVAMNNILSGSSKLPKDLNVVEKAFTSRILREKTERQLEEVEAKFVDRMEKIQIEKLNQAIFAPSLTAMVLSAVAELQSKWGELPLDQQEKQIKEADYDSDMDDMPLSILARHNPNQVEKSSNGKVATVCLARLILFISAKWGHVYHEPSHSDFAWRWELFHGQQLSTNASKWTLNSLNPRKPGSLTLERLRFVVDTKCVDKLHRTGGTFDIGAHATLSFALLPDQCGILDEVHALTQSGVVRVDEKGAPHLAEHWWESVDILLLSEMKQSWGTAIDKDGKYGVPAAVREPMESNWVESADGWALRENPDDVIFGVEEFESWRNSFENKRLSQTEEIDGVGKFGI